MDDSISFTDGAVGSAPIVLPRLLFERIQRLAARAGMTAVGLIQIALSDVFNDPYMSIERLGKLIRELPDEM
jgi:hypothetical protein